LRVVARKRLGEILVESKRISEAQLQAALDEARTSGQRLGQVLVASRLISFDDLGRAVAEQYEVPYEPLTEAKPEPEALKLITGDFAKGFRILPLAVTDASFIVAMANPDDLEALDWLQAVSSRKVEPRCALPERIERAIAYHYGVGLAAADSGVSEETEEDQDLDAQGLETMRRAGQEAPVVRLVNDIIAECVQVGASDIHFEPQRGGLEVRVRVDGALRRTRSLPSTLQPAVISRLKLMADIDISERRVPQDGRISIKAQDRRVDVRVNTLPTRWGERIVLRLLDQEGALRSLSELGMTPENERAFRAALTQPHGLVLVTGPTGSGKTTTLYAALKELKNDATNILTCEDPIEYELPGVSQTQVHERIGLTFSSQLRAALRQDPDVILVGEIRDRETAEVAARAAMTGHMVFSTLHTNDAPSAIPRMIDMGIEPYLINSSLIAVTAQRLVRMLCMACKKEDVATTAEGMFIGVPEGTKVWRERGCSACQGTGYRGRIGIHELMIVNDEIRVLALQSAASSTIREAALRGGMIPLAEDLCVKLLAGLTSPSEAMRFISRAVQRSEEERPAA
jgi:type IV pilus assembly protein PilB